MAEPRLSYANVCKVYRGRSFQAVLHDFPALEFFPAQVVTAVLFEFGTRKLTEAERAWIADIVYETVRL